MLYENFKQYYKNKPITYVLGEIKAGKTFEMLYTRLALVKEEKMEEERKALLSELQAQSRQLENNVFTEDMLLSEHRNLCDNLIYTKLVPIEENKLFDMSADDPKEVQIKGKIDRILIHGQAGIGKTTFCNHYAQVLMQNPDTYVFVIPLRYLRNASDLTDEQVLKKCIDAFSNYSPEEVRIFLRSKDKQIYWVLDGYDEVADLNEAHPLSCWLKKIFQREHIIVTTRPRTVKGFVADRYIEMTGFSNDDIYGYFKEEIYYPGYIDRYFDNEEKARAFKDFLQSQTQLKGMSRIPVVLELSCYTWEKVFSKTKKEKLPEINLSVLYENIYKALCRRYLENNPGNMSKEALQDFDEVLKEIDDRQIGDILTFIAYESFNQNKFVIKGQEIKIILRKLKQNISITTRSQILHTFGLMRCLKDQDEFDENEYTFQHLTFQEYLTAKHWVSLFSGSDPKKKAVAIDLFKAHKYNRRYELVWGFCAGLLKESSENLQAFLDLLDSAPREMIGARHLTLVLQIVGEANFLKAESREYRLITDWLTVKNPKYQIGFENYTVILARYPLLIKGSLAKYFKKLYCTEEELEYSIQLYKQHVKLEEMQCLINSCIKILEKKGNYGFRKEYAVRFLGELGQAEPKIISVLIGAFKEETRWVKQQSAIALIKLSEGKHEIILDLIKVLYGEYGYGNDKYNELSEVEEALCKLGQRKPEVIGFLVQILKNDKEDSIKRHVARALSKIGQGRDDVIHVILNILNEQEDLGKIRAIDVLGDLDKNRSDMIDALILALNDSREWVKAYAIDSLEKLGQGREDVILAILSKLNDAKHTVRSRAISVIKNLMDQTAFDVLSFLIKKLINNKEKENETSLAYYTIEALEKLAQGRQDVIDALIEMLAHKEDKVRGKVAQSLAKLSKNKPEVIDILIGISNNKGERTRRYAVEALGKLGQGRQDVIQTLILRLDDKYPQACTEVVVALYKLNCDVTSLIVDRLNNIKDNRTKIFMIASLGQLGQGKSNVIDALINVLKNSENAFVKIEAIQALGGVGQARFDVIDVLRNALNDNNQIVRGHAAYVLSNLSEKTMPDILINMLRDKDQKINDVLTSLLQKMNSKQVYILPEPVATTHQQSFKKEAFENPSNLGLSLSNPKLLFSPKSNGNIDENKNSFASDNDF